MKIGYEFDVMQQVNRLNSPNEPVDVVVCLSGRGMFNRTMSTVDAAKLQRAAHDYDPVDTYRRFAFAVKIAKEQNLLNRQKGLNKTVAIYFNGLRDQNIELRKILEQHKQHKKNFMDYPANYIAVDDILMNNTIGQCISLRLFLENNIAKFSSPPKLLFVSSAYHMPRVFRTFGCDSPLLSARFYQDNPEMLKELKQKCTGNYTLFKKIRAQLLTDNCVLSRSIIMGYGIDTIISSRSGWQLDLSGEIDAINNYSTKQIVPSIAKQIPNNVITFQYALLKHSLAVQLQDARITLEHTCKRLSLC